MGYLLPFLLTFYVLPIPAHVCVRVYCIGIMMALGLGLVLGVLIAVVALCTVCCVQYWSVPLSYIIFYGVSLAGVSYSPLLLP